MESESRGDWSPCFLGGLLRLDGMHATTTGYAILANAFLKALNREFAAGIHSISGDRIDSEDHRRRHSP
jgi:hypothetical protein